MKPNLSEKWIKASIAGTIWAASEIVLGSFLHNLRIPFSGNILTAIGIIILISINHLWREKGLFWRAGLICAVLKTMSPSAVIFGPMIAIFAEGLLLEVSTRLLGRTMPGYVIGAMLAMSWNLFHKIGSYIIYYGANIIEVYTNLLQMAQRQLKIQTDLVWMPIIILLIAYALFGLFAAIIGIRVGRKLVSQPQPANDLTKHGTETSTRRSESEFSYSVIWLMLNIVLIISSFLLLSFTDWYIWAPVITVIAFVWAIRYRRAMRQLSKPGFWIFFVFITLLTAFVFTASGEGDFWKTGFLTGISMNFRAIVIILGFSALGTELYNPVVRSFFSRTFFRNLPLAIELSVESLPYFIKAVPDFRSFIKNPVSVFHSVLSHAAGRLTEIKGKNRKIFVITGGKSKGKTTFAARVANHLKTKGIHVAGFLAERVMNKDETTGYDILNFENGERKPFLRSVGDLPSDSIRIGKFVVDHAGYEYGKKLLKHISHRQDQLVLIDEVGALELRGEGWAGCIDELLRRSANNVMIVVRDEFVEQVKKRWSLDDAVLIRIDENDFEEVAKLVSGQ